MSVPGATPPPVPTAPAGVPFEEEEVLDEAEEEADAEGDADALASAIAPAAAEAAPGKASDIASSAAPVAVATPAATGSPAVRVAFQERIRTGPHLCKSVVLQAERNARTFSISGPKCLGHLTTS
jgi:hypothetical protein